MTSQTMSSDMGTLKGFPNPPAMVRRRRGRARSARGGQGGLSVPKGRRAPHASRKPAIVLGVLMGVWVSTPHLLIRRRCAPSASPRQGATRQW